MSVVGGELAQVPEIVKGHRPGSGFDLAGTCIGLVPLDGVVFGESIEVGDALVGFRSSGVHCNGLSLARKALFENGRYAVDQVVHELGRSVGEELLEPTRSYVAEVKALLDSGVRIKALAHITSDGFLNLARVKSDVGYVIQELPEPQAIFGLIQRAGDVDDAEMFRVYNMGIGFCAVVDPADIDETLRVANGLGTDAYRLGHAVADARRRVQIEPKRPGWRERLVHQGWIDTRAGVLPDLDQVSDRLQRRRADTIDGHQVVNRGEKPPLLPVLDDLPCLHVSDAGQRLQDIGGCRVEIDPVALLHNPGTLPGRLSSCGDVPVLLVLEPDGQVDGCQVGLIRSAASQLQGVGEAAARLDLVHTWASNCAGEVDLQLTIRLWRSGWKDDLDARSGA